MTIPRSRARAARQIFLTGQFSQRRLSKKIGISRNTLADIVHCRRAHAYLAAETLTPATDPPYDGKPGRCPTCGARVLLPCIACRARQERQGGRPSPAKLQAVDHCYASLGRDYEAAVDAFYEDLGMIRRNS